MANTIINREVYASKSQIYLRNKLVADGISSAKFKADLYPGEKIHFPYGTTTRIQSGSPSTDYTIDPTKYTDNTYEIDQRKGATANFDRLQNMLAHTMNLEDPVSEEIGYQLANNIDQYTIQLGVNGALNTITGSTVTSSNVFEIASYANALLTTNRAVDGMRFFLVDPFLLSVVANTAKSNGFQLADETLINGLRGRMLDGMAIIESNNLPFTVTFTMPTIPTAGDTMIVAGKTWTWRANGGATVAGDISIGANVAAAQANFKDAINGTGTPGASTYIDMATDDRREYQNRQIACSSFSANVATLTSYGRMMNSESITPTDAVFGTESGTALFGVKGAIDLTVQAAPEIDVREEPKNRSHNLIGETQFGGGVFYRWKPSLIKLTFNTSSTF